ncbi:MAG TPA: hypothetical protein VIO84_11735 [Candidatus Dormibacteraeota bacterium]|jgi:uncharacterized membrane protein
MQNPPGPPQSNPPGPPPQSNPPAATRSGIDRKTGAALIYGLTWVGGLLGLFVFGRDDPELKYHGARSIVLWVPLLILSWIIGIVFGFIPVIRVIMPILLWIVLVVTWVYCLYKAWSTNGSRFAIPGFGPIIEPYAERLAASVK